MLRQVGYLFLDSTSWIDVFKSVADALAKEVATNLPASASVLVVLIVVGAAIVSGQRLLYFAAFALAILAILLIGALSFGSSLPIWYAILLAVFVLAGAVVGGFFMWRQVNPGPAPPTLVRALDPATIIVAVQALEKAANEVALQLKIPPAKVRASVFAPTKDSLKIVPQLTVRMNDDPSELSLEVPFGTGVVGTAWKLGKPLCARFDSAKLRQPQPWFGIPADQASKVSRDLRWVIAIPTPPIKPGFAWTVDGLVDCDDQNLSDVIPSLALWSYALGNFISGVDLLPK